MGFQDLPEVCIAHILSYTTPVDACRFSLVSKSFCTASESDTVWDRFLLLSMISHSHSHSASKKTLYLTLSDHTLIIQEGKRSVQLDKRTGKKSYMLSIRDLIISWGNDDRYWEWTTLPESRFQEVARLLDVCWFEIRGKINTLMLSSNTEYVAFLVFKMIDAEGFEYCPAELSVTIFGAHGCTKNVCLDPDLEEGELDDEFQGLKRPTLRSDGLLEIEVGEFFNSSLQDDEVQMSVMETKSGWWKRGFFLEGIEVRPPKISSDP